MWCEIHPKKSVISNCQKWYFFLLDWAIKSIDQILMVIFRILKPCFLVSSDVISLFSSLQIDCFYHTIPSNVLHYRITKSYALEKNKHNINTTCTESRVARQKNKHYLTILRLQNLILQIKWDQILIFNLNCMVLTTHPVICKFSICSCVQTVCIVYAWDRGWVRGRERERESGRAWVLYMS